MGYSLGGAARYEVQIFLLREAVNVMRDEVANAIVPVGWPPLRETLAGTISHGIPLHSEGACSLARGVGADNLSGKNAAFADPTIHADLIVWADKVVTE